MTDHDPGDEDRTEAPPHVHSWTPIPLVVARYECSCGATGRRERSGQIVAQKTDRRRTDVDARGLTRDGGRVPPRQGRA